MSIIFSPPTMHTRNIPNRESSTCPIQPMPSQAKSLPIKSNSQQIDCKCKSEILHPQVKGVVRHTTVEKFHLKMIKRELQLLGAFTFLPDTPKVCFMKFSSKKIAISTISSIEEAKKTCTSFRVESNMFIGDSKRHKLILSHRISVVLGGGKWKKTQSRKKVSRAEKSIA
jgi:hypothetical protein